jgi:hypothetical protein
MNGRWTHTLIADEQGLYDPSSTNDRTVLGIRGQVSELERDSLVPRMVEARRVFEKFDQLGAAGQVFLWRRSEGLNFPVRKMVARTHPIVWRPICNRLIYQMLRHSIYAGAFVFGRSESRRELDPETHRIVLRRGLRRVWEGWPVLIQDHHPGYISFEKYLDNQERLHRNALMTSQPTDESHQGVPRGGLARAQDLGRNLQAVWHDDPAAGECARFSLVAHWVKQGKLKAARTTVGNRQCGRIEVPSTSCENQPGLFDQMGNAISEEP